MDAQFSHKCTNRIGSANSISINDIIYRTNECHFIVIKNGSILHLGRSALHRSMACSHNRCIYWIIDIYFVEKFVNERQQSDIHFVYRHIHSFHTNNYLINVYSNSWIYTRMVHWFTNLLPFIFSLLYIYINWFVMLYDIQKLTKGRETNR